MLVIAVLESRFAMSASCDDTNDLTWNGAPSRALSTWRWTSFGSNSNP